jgi:hypothetical protein
MEKLINGGYNAEPGGCRLCHLYFLRPISVLCPYQTNIGHKSYMKGVYKE